MMEIYSLENGDDRPLRSRRASTTTDVPPRITGHRRSSSDDGTLSSAHHFAQERHFAIPRSLRNLLSSRSVDALDATDDAVFDGTGSAMDDDQEGQLLGDLNKMSPTGNNHSVSSGDETEIIVPAPESSEDDEDHADDEEGRDELASLEAGVRTSAARSVRFSDALHRQQRQQGEVDNVRRAIDDRGTNSNNNHEPRPGIGTAAGTSTRSTSSSTRSISRMSRQLSQLMSLPPDSITAKKAARASMTAQRYYRKSQMVMSTDIGKLAKEELTEHDVHKMKDVACCFAFGLGVVALLYFMLKQ
jgi:hypothetical protein